MVTQRLPELYCEGPTLAEPRSEFATTTSTSVTMLCDPQQGADVRTKPLSSDAHLYDAYAYITSEGVWYATDGSGLCPACFAAAPDTYRVADPLDIKVIDAREALYNAKRAASDGAKAYDAAVAAAQAVVDAAEREYREARGIPVDL